MTVEGVISMSTQSIRLDNETKEQATAIAAELGLTFNAVVNILVRQFNRDKGFSYPIQCTSSEDGNAFTMTRQELEAAAQAAVLEGGSEPAVDYVTLFDEGAGAFYKKYWDGRVEYVL